MLKLNTIHNLDCVAGMRKLPAGSVDLVFADPPFNIGYKYDVYDDRKEREHYLGWSKEWIGAVHKVLKPTGTFWLAIGDEYAAELKIFSQELGFTCRSWVIWYYTFGVNCKRKFSRSHAHLFHFVKDAEQFTFNLDDPAIRIPSARQLVYADARANPKGRLPDDTWILRPQDLPDGFSADSDTWYFPRVAGTFKERAGFHGCQMPEQLLGRIIRASSNAATDGQEKGDLVLDPFSGSATTLVVAKKLGREFVGFDLSKDYVASGLARLKAVKTGAFLEGAAEPLKSAPATPGTPRPHRPRALKAAAAQSTESAPRAKRGELTVPTVARKSGAKSAQKQSAPATDGAGTSQRKGVRAKTKAPARSAPSKPDPAKTTTTKPTIAKPAPVKTPRPKGEDLSQGIIEAFLASHDGYSADRVVADPQLNQEFARHCTRLGLAGSLKEWNLALFGLRKHGKLTGLPASRTTEFDWDAADQFLFASEIALAEIEASSISLDRALCDPELATRFDRTAASFAPGHMAFEYRWAALGVRKAFSQAQRNAARVESLPLDTTVRLGEGAFDSLRGTRGAYLFSSSPSRSGALFVGETLDLGHLCSLALSGGGLRDSWRAHASKLFVWYTTLDSAHDRGARSRFARVARLVSDYAPRLNYRPANSPRNTAT